MNLHRIHGAALNWRRSAVGQSALARRRAVPSAACASAPGSRERPVDPRRPYSQLARPFWCLSSLARGHELASENLWSGFAWLAQVPDTHSAALVVGIEARTGGFRAAFTPVVFAKDGLVAPFLRAFRDPFTPFVSATNGFVGPVLPGLRQSLAGAERLRGIPTSRYSSGALGV